MFFVLSKLLGVFTYPSNVVILVGILGLLLLTTRFAHAGRWLEFVSLLVLAILGLSPIGNTLLIPLESRFPPGTLRAERRTGSSCLAAWSMRRARQPGNAQRGAERLAVVPDLDRRYPNARILFSGRSGALVGDSGAEARSAARLLEKFWRRAKSRHP